MIFTTDATVRYHPERVLLALSISRPDVTARMLIGLAF